MVKKRMKTTELPSTPAAIRMWALLELVLAWFLPLATIVVFLAMWEYAGRLFSIPEFLLPSPSAIFRRLVLDWPQVWPHFLFTASMIVEGFLLATAVAIPLAIVIASFPSIERGLYPIIAFSEMIPKTIIAPLLIVWFGIGIGSKLALTALLTFFPILVGTISGLRSIDPQLYHITRSMGASGRQTFLYMQIPAALPFIFSGLKIASVFAVGGELLAEFIGSTNGLGFLIIQASNFMDLEQMFAAIVAVTLQGLVFFYAIALLEHVFTPWARPDR